MSTLKDLRNKLFGEIRAAIQSDTDQSYEQLAIRFGVSRSTICEQALILKQETGFARRPVKENHNG